MPRQAIFLGERRGFGGRLTVLLTLLAPAAMAADPHTLFEERCGRCHGDAGPFARQALKVERGEVRGARSGTAVEGFLAGHMGGLDAADIDLLVDTFRRQLAWGGLYQERCRTCHDQARRLARRYLVLGDDGRLVSRYTGQNIARFLAWHGRLAPDEVPVIVEMLRWQLASAEP
jgi:hypothetical protein